MAADFKVNWKGDEVTDHTIIAAKRAIDGIMSKCVVTSKMLVPVITAILQGSIRVVKFATKESDSIQGQWGSVAVKYALPVEKGTGPYTHKNLFGKGIIAKMPARKGKPYLIPSAEQHYPDLPSRCRRELDAMK